MSTMDYHLFYGVNKYLWQNSINMICSLNIYNNGIKNTYLHKIPIIRIKYSQMNEKISKKYKYIVTRITTGEELRKTMKYGIHIIGIILKDYEDEIIGLPQTLKLLKIWRDNFDQSVDKLLSLIHI